MFQGVSITAFLWSTVDKFGGILIAFLLNLILARFFLTPRDYGLIGMINVFISIANTTAIAGFGQAIIQSKKIEKEDYNTTFTFNLLVGIVLYLVLFFTAPLISSFYREPQLISIVRVLGLVLIINGFFIVQQSVLVRNMRFKRLSFISLLALGISAVLSIILASNGWGVWTLVANTLVASLLQTLLMYYGTDVKVRLQFSKKSFIKLFSFGSFMYLSTLLDVLQTNLLNLILGKRFSPQVLGYYTQAEKLQNVPSNTLGTIVNQVTFPVFSKMQDSLTDINDMFRNSMKLMCTLSTSVMGLFAVLAPALIVVLLSDIWEPSVKIFQILCFVGIFYPLNSTSTNVIKSLGKGNVFFFLQLLKSIGGIIMLLFFSFYGLYSLLITLCCINVLFYIANVFVVSRLTGAPLVEMLSLPVLQGFPAFIAFTLTFVVLKFCGVTSWLYIIFASVLYFGFLLLLFEVFKFKEYLFVRNKCVEFWTHRYNN